MCCQFSNNKQGEGERRGRSHVHENKYNNYKVVPLHYTRALAVAFVPHFTAGRTSRLQRVRCYRYGGKAPYTP